MRTITYTHPTLNPLSIVNWLRHESKVTLKTEGGEYATTYAFIPQGDDFLYVEHKTDGQNEVFLVTDEFDPDRVYPYLTTQLAFVTLNQFFGAN